MKTNFMLSLVTQKILVAYYMLKGIGLIDDVFTEHHFSASTRNFCILINTSADKLWNFRMKPVGQTHLKWNTRKCNLCNDASYISILLISFKNQGNYSLPVFADFNFRQYHLLLKRQYPNTRFMYHRQNYRRR